MSSLQLAGLEPFDPDSKDLRVIVETPRGSSNKLKYDESIGIFRLRRALPFGLAFPFDFGFVPSTRAEDGDPLDALLLVEAPTAVGCLVDARPLGVLRARQPKGSKVVRNDRLVAVASVSRRHAKHRSLRDLDESLLSDIERFFVAYQAAEGSKLEFTGRGGPDAARRLVREAMKRFRRAD